MRFCLKTLVVFVAVSLGSFAAYASASKADAQAMVDKAVAFAKSNGKEKLVSEVNTKDGQFHKGDLYVFVYDLSGTLLANPVEVALRGQNNIDKPDAEGKLFRKEIVDTAKSKGSGWVDYKHASAGKTVAKSAYFKKEGDVIIAAGAVAE